MVNRFTFFWALLALPLAAFALNVIDGKGLEQMVLASGQLYVTSSLDAEIETSTLAGTLTHKNSNQQQDSEEILLLVEVQGDLRIYDGDGRSLSLQTMELSRARGVRRLAVFVDRTRLADGLLFEELPLAFVGDPVGTETQGSIMSRDPWAQGSFLCIETSQTGLHSLSADQLREWRDGVFPDDDWPDPRLWTLVHNGEAVPMRIIGVEDGRFDGDDRLEFWAEPSLPELPELGPDMQEDPWSRVECWFLSTDGQPGLRMAQESGEIVETNPDLYASPTTFPELLHVEETNHFSRLTYVIDEPYPDHRFWTTGIYAGQLREIPFDVPGVDSHNLTPVLLRLCLRGLSAPSDSEEEPYRQRLRVYLNDQGGQGLEVGGEGDWQNQDLRIVEFGDIDLPDHSVLHDGENRLFLAGVGEAPANEFSASMLNWIEVEYRRFLVADENQLLLRVDPALDGALVNYEISGFEGDDIELYRLGRSHLRNAVVRPLGSGYRLRFQTRVYSGERFVALTQAAKLVPDTVRSVEPLNLAATSNRGAYLILMADSLHREGVSSLDPLVQRLEDDGLGPVMILSDQSVYDEFSNGKVRPHAIRDLMHAACANWSVPPEYLLLLGDGLLDQRQSGPREFPVLPLAYEQVYKWGAAANDDWFISGVDGGYLPTLVGRWPLKNLDEVDNMVAKLLAYDEAEVGDWCNRVLLTAGAKSRDDGVFLAQTENLIRFRLPESRFIRRIEAGETGDRYIGSRDELMAFFDQGVLLANYSGHGGGAVWEDNDLFRSSDVALLNNEARLPFITNATCFIASLEYDNALGRSLLNSGEMGAIGVLGSTGYGFRDTGMELVAEFTEIITHNPSLRVAEALRMAKERMIAMHVIGHEGTNEALFTEAVLAMNTILGLPSQRLHFPGFDVQPALENPVVETGDLLQISGTAQPGSPVHVEFYSANSHPHQTGSDFVNDIDSRETTVEADSSWSLEWELPSALYRGGDWGTLRTWVGGDDQKSSVNWFYFADSLEQAFVWRAQWEPEAPLPGEDVDFSVHAVAPEPVDSLVAELLWQSLAGDSSRTTHYLDATAGNPQLFSTQTPLGNYAHGDQLRLWLTVYYGASQTSTTQLFIEVLEAQPELEWRMVGYGDEYKGMLLLECENGGSLASSGLSVQVETGESEVLGTLSLASLVPGEQRQDYLHLPFGSLGDQLHLTLIDSLSDSPASLELGMDDLFLREGDEPRAIGSSLELEMSGGVDGSYWKITSLETNPQELLNLQELQPDLVLVAPAFACEPSGMPGVLQGTWIIALEDSSLLAETQLMERVGNGPFARRLVGSSLAEVEADVLRVEFALDNPGGLALGTLNDDTAPSLVLSVDDQLLTPGGFVPDQPRFSAVVSDVNGVDSRFFTVEVNGLVVDSTEFFSELVAGDGLFSWLPDFSDYERNVEHLLFVRAFDAAGNVVEFSQSFRLASGVRLEHIGSYPNPFQRDTRFIFSLTGVVDEARIDIYTVSGRRVRRLNLPGPLINYAELYWDGRDEVGDRVANGVYFYRFAASGSNGSVEQIGKLARVK